MGYQVALVEDIWNKDAAAALAGAAGAGDTYTLDDLQREIMSGAATLYKVTHGMSEILGWCVLWIDNFGQTKELVLQSGAGLASDGRAVRLTLPVLADFARSHGCLSMRAHVSDARMLGHLKHVGFKKTETVMVMKV